MSRLLFVSPFPPRLDAVHGGSRVIAQLIKHLGRRHPVALMALRARHDPPTDPELLRTLDLVREVEMASPSGWKRRLRQGLDWMRGLPRWVSDYRAEDFAESLVGITRTWRPDVVHLEYHIMGQYLPALTGLAPVVLTHYDAAAPNRLSGGPVGSLTAACDRWTMGRYERGLTGAMQAIIVFTQEDARIVQHYAGATPIAVIPRGLEMPPKPCDPEGAQPPTVLFIGNYTHPPNADAAVRLIDRIFPAVQRSVPRAKLQIVGPEPTPAMLRTAAPGVEITGQVPDTMPYLDQAGVVVAPLFQGGGQRVKVLEALAAGKALIATSRAVAGLSLVPGEQFALAETNAEFAEAIVHLLSHPDERRSLARQARTWAEQHAGWDRAVEAYERLYAELVPPASAVGRPILPTTSRTV